MTYRGNTKAFTKGAHFDVLDYATLQSLASDNFKLEEVKQKGGRPSSGGWSGQKSKHQSRVVESYKFFYTDEDNDLICISSQAEFIQAAKSASSVPLLRLIIAAEADKACKQLAKKLTESVIVAQANEEDSEETKEQPRLEPQEMNEQITTEIAQQLSAQTDTRKICDEIVKFILIGDTMVGKTSISLRFQKNEFNEKVDLTPTVDIFTRKIECKNKTVMIQVHDCAGSQQSQDMITKNYYKKAQTVLFVFDCSNKQTFDNLPNWMKQVEDNCAKDVFRVLVANKIDVNPKSRQVSREVGQKFAETHHMKYYETSARTGQGISNLFSQEISAQLKK